MVFDDDEADDDSAEPAPDEAEIHSPARRSSTELCLRQAGRCALLRVYIRQSHGAEAAHHHQSRNVRAPANADVVCNLFIDLCTLMSVTYSH
eukprot:CAMPEP_0185189804 /NCGR_PEP_ID=MMETSP1140-20130426/6263_1 /TAXON_ID=298111 /ORGANISM="Pavlova sp., Strain CCMP459" /LENGTH=91 /DNA_ID=CAMNT_0027756391 /DNA_START=420 /DNA_END=692 /DNA_ORIENTATION=-